jgi:hypothetical protein
MVAQGDNYQPMTYHRYTMLDGCYMSVIDIKKYKQHRYNELRRLGYIKAIVLISALMALALPAHLAAQYA